MLFRTLLPGTPVLVASAHATPRTWRPHAMKSLRMYWAAHATDGRTRSTIFKDGDYLIKAKAKDVAMTTRHWSH